MQRSLLSSRKLIFQYTVVANWHGTKLRQHHFFFLIVVWFFCSNSSVVSVHQCEVSRVFPMVRCIWVCLMLSSWTSLVIHAGLCLKFPSRESGISSASLQCCVDASLSLVSSLETLTKKGKGLHLQPLTALLLSDWQGKLDGDSCYYA